MQRDFYNISCLNEMLKFTSFVIVLAGVFIYLIAQERS